MAEVNALEWTLGLRNHASGKFLTQETFGFAVNVNGGGWDQSVVCCLLAHCAGASVYHSRLPH